MDSAADILTLEFEELKSDLAAKYIELGMRASGDWEDSLDVNVTERSGTVKATITGLDYSRQLESGRAPGKQPPSDVIEQWIKDKGIAFNMERNISISTLAFLIARKIGREGWKRQGYGGVDLISQVVTPERIQSIIDKVSDIYVPSFTNEIINYLRQAA